MQIISIILGLLISLNQTSTDLSPDLSDKGLKNNDISIASTTPNEASMKASVKVAETRVKRPVQQKVSQKVALNKSDSKDFKSYFKDQGIEISGLKTFPGTVPADLEDFQECGNKLQLMTSKLPLDSLKHLKKLILYFDSNGRRGWGGGEMIVLRCTEVTDEEMLAVLIHELGHIEDGSGLIGSSAGGESNFMDGKRPVLNNDLSLEYYRISFTDQNSLKATAKETDFVSGYAMSDPFEDFAETYNFYFLHGNKFRKIAENNIALTKKYKFMRDNVFEGREYSYDDQFLDNSQIAPELENGLRDYDSTILSYNYKKLLDFK